MRPKLSKARRSISIHAPRVGSDIPRGAPTKVCRHFNPRSPCGERRLPPRYSGCCKRISIHAPRVGSDVFCSQSPGLVPLDFNPRSPCGERLRVALALVFLIANFNPRSPCGERLSPGELQRKYVDISIHAPRVGSDAGAGSQEAAGCISIHAPRVGSDAALVRFPAEDRISIHAPRVGSDLQNIHNHFMSGLFQSTLPVWGATYDHNGQHKDPSISIHAPRVGSDRETR